MATFRNLPSGKVQVTVRIRGFKPVTKSFDKKRPAQRWASEMESDLRAGKHKDHTHESGTLYSVLAERYWKEVSPTKGRPMRDKAPYELTTQFFKYEYIEKITPQRVYELVQHLETKKGKGGVEGLSANSKKQYLTFIQNVYMWANAFWDIPCENPVPTAKFRAKKLRKLTEPPERDRRLKEGEEELLLTDTRSHFQQSSKYIPMHEICMIAIDTAMRRREIAEINIKNINFVDSTYKIERSKTDYQTGKKGRIIPLSDRVLEIFKKKVPFYDGRLYPWAPDSFTQKFIRYTKEKGIKDLVLHDLRHEATSRLFELGLEIQHVQPITGHESWESLQRYTHIKAKHLSEKMRELKIKAEQIARETAA